MASAWRNEPMPLSLVFMTVIVAARTLCMLAAIAAQSSVIRRRGTNRVFIGECGFWMCFVRAGSRGLAHADLTCIVVEAPCTHASARKRRTGAPHLSVGSCHGFENATFVLPRQSGKIPYFCAIKSPIFALPNPR